MTVSEEERSVAFEFNRVNSADLLMEICAGDDTFDGLFRSEDGTSILSGLEIPINGHDSGVLTVDSPSSVDEEGPIQPAATVTPEKRFIARANTSPSFDLGINFESLGQSRFPLHSSFRRRSYECDNNDKLRRKEDFKLADDSKFRASDSQLNAVPAIDEIPSRSSSGGDVGNSKISIPHISGWANADEHNFKSRIESRRVSWADMIPRGLTSSYASNDEESSNSSDNVGPHPVLRPFIEGNTIEPPNAEKNAQVSKGRRLSQTIRTAFHRRGGSDTNQSRKSALWKGSSLLKFENSSSDLDSSTTSLFPLRRMIESKMNLSGSVGNTSGSIPNPKSIDRRSSMTISQHSDPLAILLDDSMSSTRSNLTDKTKDDTWTLNKLHLSDLNLFGREDELKLLRDAFAAVKVSNGGQNEGQQKRRGRRHSRGADFYSDTRKSAIINGSGNGNDTTSKSSNSERPEGLSLSDNHLDILDPQSLAELELEFATIHPPSKDDLTRRDHPSNNPIPHRNSISPTSPNFMPSEGTNILGDMGIDDDSECNTTVQTSQHFVVVEGSSGTGKTQLVRQLREPVSKAGGFFVTGRFDTEAHQKAYVGFISAFEDIGEKICESPHRDKIVSSLLQTMGNDANAILDLVPNSKFLRDVLQQSSAVGDSRSTQSWDTSRLTRLHPLDDRVLKRSSMPQTSQGWPTELNEPKDRYANSRSSKIHLNFAIVRFLRTLASPEHPVVLFLDDLQWADESSLDLAECIVKELCNHALLLIGACRHDEVQGNHPLNLTLSRISAKVSPTRISIGNLGISATSSYVADAMGMDPSDTCQLAEVIHRKTNGNAFFVGLFLRSLQERQLIEFNFGTMRWHWDIDRITASFVTDNVAAFLSESIKDLPKREKFILQVASCLGVDFAFSVLRLSLKDFGIHGIGLASALEGFLEKGMLDTGTNDDDLSFVHESIRSAAFHLIPMDKRDVLRCRIGTSIVKHASEAELEEMLFVVVYLCNYGKSSIRKGEGLKLSELNLRAGLKALKAASYTEASSFLESGLEILNREELETANKLYIDLCSNLCTAYYCIGDRTKLEKIANEVLGREDISLADKIQVYTVRILLDGATQNFDRGIKTANDVLRQLGVSNILTSSTKMSYFTETMKTKMVMRRHSRESLARLPMMEDKKHRTVMRMLSFLQLLTYMDQPDLFPLVAMRQVRYTIKHGVSTYSCMSIANYGVILQKRLRDYDSAVDYGRVSLDLLERLHAREATASVLSILYGNLFPWKLPLRSGIQALRCGYQIGLETGEIEGALTCLAVYARLEFAIGTELAAMQRKLLSFHDQAMKYNQLAVKEIIQPFYYATQALRYSALDFVDPVHHENMLVENPTLTTRNFWYHIRVMLACILKNYKSVALDIEKRKDKIETFEVFRNTFYEYLICVSLSRVEKLSSKWIKRSKKLAKKIELWVQAGNINCVHISKIVAAEQFSLKGDTAKAKEEFHSAAMSSVKTGFPQDRALAYERAGEHFLRIGDNFWAKYNLQCAYERYFEWGAFTKVEQMEKEHGNIFSQPQI